MSICPRTNKECDDNAGAICTHPKIARITRVQGPFIGKSRLNTSCYTLIYLNDMDEFIKWSKCLYKT